MANELKHASAGTVLTQAEFEAIGLHVLNSQATGDLIFASSVTQLSRLGIGSTNQLLTVIGGVPTWQSTLSGLTLTSPTVNGATIATSTLTSPTINGTIATTGLTMPTHKTISSSRLQESAATETAFKAEYIISSTTIQTWTTVLTITPSAVAGVYTEGIVEAWICGGGQTSNGGSKKTIWSFRITNANPVVAQVGADIDADSPADLRLVQVGTAVQIQLQSFGGAGLNMADTAYIKIYCPIGSGSPTWTIT